MEKFKKLNLDEHCEGEGSGLVQNCRQLVSAQAFCTAKMKRPTPVGVLLGEGHETVCKVRNVHIAPPPPLSIHTSSPPSLQLAVHSEHVVNERAVELLTKSNKVLHQTRTRTSTEKDITMGYKSFKRGDLVVWDGPIEDDNEVDGEVIEVVYGCMVFNHRKQQRRYLITYSPELNSFSTNCWPSWKRKPATPRAMSDRARRKTSYMLSCR